METIYIVIYNRYDEQLRQPVRYVGRVFKTVESAFNYITVMTGLSLEDVEAQWSDGFADIEWYGTVYSIEEHVLES